MFRTLFTGLALTIGQADRLSAQAPAAAAQDGPASAAPAAASEQPATEIIAPLLPPPAATAEPAAAIAATTPDRWFLMRELQGTWYGAVLEDQRTQINGWTEFSYTASTADVNNQPVVWNDRANEFLLQQHWIRFERSLVTSGTTEPTFGYRFDFIIGSDYRFTLPRGLWNSQLLNSTGAQNLYGIDAVEHYVTVYFPNIFQGTELRVGRHYCPFGVETLEAVTTPLLSRSYAFNWSPPFTHVGLMALTTLNAQWSTNLMLVNGNDVYIDPAQEMRFVGKLAWTSIDKQDAVAFGTSVGRGKFNAGDPFNPATVGLMYEPAGRNNINVFDIVYTHVFNDRLSYNFECIFGYQYGVPTNVLGGSIRDDATHSTAKWGSICQYLNYAFTPKLGSVLRVEFFDDFDAQRTGFEGLYSAVTAGIQIKPSKDVTIRPELRYDYNGYSLPFEGKHDLFTAAADIIFRW